MNKNPNTSGLAARMTTDNQPAKRGRPTGSLNKNNLVRAWVDNNFPGGFEGYLDNLIQTINLIEDPAKRAHQFTAIMPYMAPTLKSLDASISIDPNDSKLTIIYSTSSSPSKPKPDILDAEIN